MQIQNGKLYENRTWKYIYPSLKYYGEELTTYLSSFFKLAVGVGDKNYESEVADNCIYILFDTNVALEKDNKAIHLYKQRFSRFLDWLKEKHYYVQDYPYEAGKKHMIVLKLPHAHHGSFVSFINGKYSEMYSKVDINKYFEFLKSKSVKLQEAQHTRVRRLRQILTKDVSYVKEFVGIVNKRFNTEVGTEHFSEAELDFKPELQEEIFNYE